MSDNYEEMIVNHYMKIHILTKAFGEQIEATQNLKCVSCENYIFSDKETEFWGSCRQGAFWEAPGEKGEDSKGFYKIIFE